MGRLSRYVLARTVGGVGLALGSVLAAIMLIDLVEQMRSVGQRVDLTLLQAIELTLLKAPILIEQTLPFVILAGVMIAIIQLNRRSELVAMRAAGVSAWRFLAPPIGFAVLLGVIVVLVVNPMGAAMYERFESQRDALLAQRTGPPEARGVWLRQGDETGQVVIRADVADAQAGRLQDVTFFFFDYGDDTLLFSHRLRAAGAELKPGFWQLSEVVEAAPGKAPERFANLAIPTNLDASDLLERLVSPASQSFWTLPSFIADARTAGLSPLRFEIKWMSLLAYPILLASMAALGGVFSLRLQRTGDIAQWGAVGVSLGLALFFFTQLAQALAITQAVPPLIAGFSAPLAGLFCALGIVCFLEDG